MQSTAMHGNLPTAHSLSQHCESRGCRSTLCTIKHYTTFGYYYWFLCTVFINSLSIPNNQNLINFSSFLIVKMNVSSTLILQVYVDNKDKGIKF